MNRMIRSLRSTLRKTLVLSALALSLLVTSAVAFAAQESGGGEQQRRGHPNELTFTLIDFPGALGTDASSINDRGQTVGSYADSPDCINTLVGCHGYLLDNGDFTTIDFPGATQSAAIGINDRGKIVGYFFDAVGAQHGFLAECDGKKLSRGQMESPSPVGQMCSRAARVK